ncbi:MAG: DNA methyltransferase [Chloroflexota bacterium]
MKSLTKNINPLQTSSYESLDTTQLSLFDTQPYGTEATRHNTEHTPPPQLTMQERRSGSFVDNMKLPVHRWFRYSAGFSAEWVQSMLKEHQSGQEDGLTVLDPFAGSGTTLLACNAENVRSYGFEAHPFVYRIALAKLDSIRLDPIELKNYLRQFGEQAKQHSVAPIDDVPALLTKCFSEETLQKLFVFKDLYCSTYATSEPESEVLWLILTAILRGCSFAGTAQWQYVLPNKRKSKVLDPFDAYHIKVDQVLSDIIHAQSAQWKPQASILQTDARHPSLLDGTLQSSVDLVITSPPYPNNYDYADATRLEMTFWGEVSGWKDLQSKVRTHLIRSCSQHASAEKLQLDDLLQDEILLPIHDELSTACHQLAEVRLTKGGRKTYHTMAAAYFRDLGYVFQSLRPLCKEGAKVCFVIGDSAPYGIYLHVDEWLGKLAVAAGFHSFSFEKTRDRNTKWKNRKHRVPLKEGRLWIQG